MEFFEYDKSHPSKNVNNVLRNNVTKCRVLIAFTKTNFSSKDGLCKNWEIFVLVKLLKYIKEDD